MYVDLQMGQRRSVAASDDIWRIEMKCGFPVHDSYALLFLFRYSLRLGGPSVQCRQRQWKTTVYYIVLSNIVMLWWAARAVQQDSGLRSTSKKYIIPIYLYLSGCLPV